MTRHFSIPAFFRLVPNALLKRYFLQRDVLGDVDFEELPETRPAPLLAAGLGKRTSTSGGSGRMRALRKAPSRAISRVRWKRAVRFRVRPSRLAVSRAIRRKVGPSIASAIT